MLAQCASSWASASLLSLLLACTLVASSVAAPSSGIDIEKLTALPESGDIAAAYVFPAYPAKQFPAGKLVDVVVGLRNDGAEAYNLSLIAGSLNSPVDFNLYVQNFSHLTYGQILGPGEELSLEYKFFPDRRLDPRDFTVALSLVYANPKGEWHSLTFFNETVNIVEPKKLIDWELLSLFLIFGGFAAGIAYAVYSYVVSLGWLKSQKKRSRTKKQVTAGAGGAPPVMSAEDQQDWVKGTPYDAFLKQRTAAAKGSSKRTPGQGAGGGK